jgi:hypothetical protein
MPLLFSYGTLREKTVQVSLFGRPLHGRADELVGFEQSWIEIEDPEFAAESGTRHHAIVRRTDRPDSRVRGIVFEVSEDELEKADRYEPAGYARIRGRLASGEEAWVYAASGSATLPPA